MNTWEEIFKKEGKVFEKPHEDMPKLVKLLKKYKTKKILDLGCGPGRHLIYLAKKGFDVSGLDNSETALKMANLWLKKTKLKAHVKNIDFYQPLPYANNFFDAVISHGAIHHGTTKKVKQIIAEITRVLKKHGMIFITVPQRHHKSSIDPTASFKGEKVEERVIIPLAGPEKGIPHFYFNKKLIKEFFCDFEIQELYAKNHDYCFIGLKK